MGPFKKYVSCIMAIFTPFDFVTLLILLYHFLCVIHYVLLGNGRMREEKIFCIYGCFSVSRYVKEGRKLDL